MSRPDYEELMDAFWPLAEDTFMECDRRYNEGWGYVPDGYESRVAFICRTLVDIELLPLTHPEDTR